MLAMHEPTQGDGGGASNTVSRGAKPVAQRLERIDAQIGARIRFRRRQLGLNQSELSKTIGVTFQQVHKYETGRSAVTAARLFAIAAALTCPVGYFYDDLNPDMVD